MRSDGYFTLPGDLVGVDLEQVARVRRAVRAVTNAGWAASFVMVYDDALALAAQYGAVVEAVSGNRPLFDIQASLVDPALSQAGFGPHRDRPFGPAEGTATPRSFRGRKGKFAEMPKFCTCWIGLSEAMPDNGCMYVLPRAADHGYSEGDMLSVSGPNAVAPHKWGLRQSPTGNPIWSPNQNQAFASVRAVPCHSGDAMVISHRVLHWGSQGRPESELGPRISLTCSLAKPSFEQPFVQDVGVLGQSLEARLALAAAQTLSYEDQASRSMTIDPEKREVYERLCRSFDGFTEQYAERVSRFAPEAEGGKRRKKQRKM
eukprot:TRINITY_DN20532_c0_g1_i3.p2 TRINITY_DN20532_c0_g1~~TRINITY_DN20532_c0_g1_i3.p2  ORF type:complete len:317 (+),score=51.63 TRINITY_DN20532_c0_g1_i3:221-1171(+)